MATTKSVLTNFLPVFALWIHVLGIDEVKAFECPRNSTGHCIDGQYTNVYDCTTFWSCSDCSAWLQNCPEPLEFNERLGSCVNPEYSNCTEISTTPGSTTTTFTETTTTPPQSTTEDLTPPIAVSVARTTNFSGPANPLAFPELVVNFGSGWDRLANTLNVSETSIYFFHLNAGAAAGGEVNMNLRGSYNADIYRNSTAHTGTDTLSRDIVQTVKAGSTLKITNEYMSNLFSDSGRQTSFSAFELQDFLSSADQKIFSVARNDEYTTYGPLPFDDILVDTANNWNSSRYEITESGLYFFTLSCGIRSAASMRAQIKSASNGTLAEIWRGSRSNNGHDILSVAVMGELVRGDFIYVDFVTGQLYSDSERQTSLAGFQYSPVHGEQHAWSVFRTGRADVGPEPLDPLPFHGAHVNTGLFGFDDHQIHIRQAGLYYVSLYVGIERESTLEAYIIRGTSRTEAQISRSSTYHNGEDSMGQGILLELSAGDTLKVVLSPFSQLYSDVDKQTVFTGFLLYPYPN